MHKQQKDNIVRFVGGGRAMMIILLFSYTTTAQLAQVTQKLKVMILRFACMYMIPSILQSYS